jgi:phage tail sheath protein FI
MAANFLHGVETTEIDKGPRAVRLVKTSVVGIVGTAATGAVNQNVLITKESDIAQFGTEGPGLTLVRELKRLFSQKPTVCVVRNVYDPVRHNGSAANVQPGDIIGGIDPVTGKRLGLAGFQDAYQQFGFAPKILIAPGFAALASVSAALVARATALRAVAFMDAPVGITPQQAITGRGPTGSINFNTSSDRAGLCYPYAQMYNPETNANELSALSTIIAGAWSRRDQENGYWWSGSNLELLNVIGMERPIEAMINDPNCEANLLNEAGIITMFNSFGTGIRSWGNRSAAWPAVSDMRNFINVRRTADIIFESMELATQQFMDGPLNNARIDDVLETGNRFIRHQQANGAIAGGKVYLDPEKNSPTDLAAGRLSPTIEFSPYAPLERVSYTGVLSTEWLKLSA